MRDRALRTKSGGHRPVTAAHTTCNELPQQHHPSAFHVEGAAHLVDVHAGRQRLVRVAHAVPLDLMRSGLSTGRIAEELYVSPGTVRSHVMSLMRKLHAPDRAALLGGKARARPRARALVH